MCATDHHDMTLAVKMALNLNTTNQQLKRWSFIILPAFLLSVNVGLIVIMVQEL